MPQPTDAGRAVEGSPGMAPESGVCTPYSNDTISAGSRSKWSGHTQITASSVPIICAWSLHLSLFWLGPRCNLLQPSFFSPVGSAALAPVERTAGVLWSKTQQPQQAHEIAAVQSPVPPLLSPCSPQESQIDFFAAPLKPHRWSTRLSLGLVNPLS